MTAEICIMGLFKDDAAAARAIRDLPAQGFGFRRAHSPLPSRRIAETLGLKKGRVGWFTLAGGVIGFFTGFSLGIYASTQWNLIVSGKPIISLIPFFILGFEFTILFSVLGNVLGLLVCSKLPDYAGLDRYDPRCSGEHFGVLAACGAGRERELVNFFQKKGAEVRVFT